MKCFVIMGYGVKTDYTTGRVIDLDKTYHNIIKPVVESISDMECVRADEIPRSGVIDVEMYRLLLQADIVIADLSTYNCNAIYELGIRHALKPRTTIVISEKELVYPFDLNHIMISKYEHLCKDIGYCEVERFRTELKSMITAILKDPKTDSPVYTFLSSLEPPFLNEEITAKYSSEGASISNYIIKTKEAFNNSDFKEAITQLKIAMEFDKNNPYLRQKLALATYKSEKPTKKESLAHALKIMEPLNPQLTTDPETLGLHGAVYKRLWELEQVSKWLNLAIHFYTRGFIISRDYYNGINLAYLHNVRAAHCHGDERITDFVIANRIRKEVIELCSNVIEKVFDEGEKYWIYATLEEAYFALNDSENYDKYKSLCISCNPAEWMRKTTENQINKLSSLLKMEEK